MKNNTILILACLMMFLAISLGAFGAHAWQNILVQHQTNEAFATASQYHFIHALSLLWLGFYIKVFKQTLILAPCLMLIGTVIFSGSLYWLSLSGIRWLGAITPIGGILLLASWALIIWHLYKSNKE